MVFYKSELTCWTLGSWLSLLIKASCFDWVASANCIFTLFFLTMPHCYLICYSRTLTSCSQSLLAWSLPRSTVLIRCLSYCSVTTIYIISRIYEILSVCLLFLQLLSHTLQSDRLCVCFSYSLFTLFDLHSQILIFLLLVVVPDCQLLILSLQLPMLSLNLICLTILITLSF